jgi:hypothetical protein
LLFDELAFFFPARTAQHTSPLSDWCRLLLLTSTRLQPDEQRRTFSRNQNH